jgi:hypothetical protein
MLRHLRSNAIAYLALFVALGGTGAYAAATITGKDVVDNSLTSRDVVGLTGKDIVESKLGQVPSSTELNGVSWRFYPTITCGKRPAAGETTVLCQPGAAEITNINYQSSGGDGAIAEIGPDLDINGFCDSGSPTSTSSDDLKVVVVSRAPRISVHAEWTANGDGVQHSFDYAGGPLQDVAQADFLGAADDDAAGTLVYTNANTGEVITMTFQAEDSEDGERPFAGLNNRNCLFSGMAIRTTPSKIGN